MQFFLKHYYIFQLKFLLFLGGYTGARVAGLWRNQISDTEYIHRVEEMHTVDYGHPGMDGK